MTPGRYFNDLYCIWVSRSYLYCLLLLTTTSTYTHATAATHLSLLRLLLHIHTLPSAFNTILSIYAQSTATTHPHTSSFTPFAPQSFPNLLKIPAPSHSPNLPHTQQLNVDLLHMGFPGPISNSTLSLLHTQARRHAGFIVQPRWGNHCGCGLYQQAISADYVYTVKKANTGRFLFDLPLFDSKLRSKCNQLVT